jgi:membrane protein required for colicin V production
VGDLAGIDLVCLGIVSLAVLRGLAIGMIREAFSLAAIAAAVVAVRLLSLPVAGWLLTRTELDLGTLGARLAAGGLVALGAILTMRVLGRVLRRGARVMGLGAMDRLAGGALGAAEGALVAGVVLLALVTLLGDEHPSLAGSRSLAAFETLERLAGTGDADVAAAPPPDGPRRAGR